MYTFADRPCIDSSRYGDNPTQILKYRHRWQYQKTIIVVMFRPRFATSTPWHKRFDAPMRIYKYMPYTRAGFASFNNRCQVLIFDH